jgi:type VI secretion system protein ImpL
MAKYILKAIKIFLVLVLLAAAGFGLYLLVEFMGWPWWVAPAMGLGLLGLVLGGLFLRRWFFRRREKKFVERIVQHDESIIGKRAVGERQQLQDLQTQWKNAVAALRGSHLRKLGNPLYVLPWYLIIGEPGSGKTTAIQSARLHSALTEVSPAAGISGTRNCDWWFFDQAVLLDTAGRYTSPVDEGPDKEEWQKFLSLLAKYRRREPLNGVVVAVAADRLITSDPDVLAEEAQNVRRRVDEVMRVLGAKIPIYVLVTKLDRILGISAFGDLLPAGALNQAMGEVNVGLRHDPRDMVEESLEATSERLKDLRLLLLHRHGAVDPSILLFPDELATLKPKLSQFVEAVFVENLYLETPLLRGIYFSSGRQEGCPYSQLMDTLGIFKDHPQELPSTEKGLFLKDFFARILPGDRDLFTPLREFVAWRRLTRNLGLSAWTLIMVFAAALLTLSYVKNQSAMKGFIDNYQSPPALTGDLGHDLVVMSGLREELLELEQSNLAWWLPRLGLEQSLELEHKLEAIFCRFFVKGFMEPLDRDLSKGVQGFNAATPGETISVYVAHLASRINLLQAETRGASHKELAKMRPPAYGAIVALDENLIPEIAARFGPLYISYLEWSPDQRALSQEMWDMKNYLQHVMNSRGGSMTWVADWANLLVDLQPVTLDEFWGAERLEFSEKVSVPRAFTVKGRARIEGYLEQLEQALNDPQAMAERLREFDIWYWREYQRAWLNFGQRFDNGYIRLESAEDRRDLAQIMADERNPYFKLLDRMGEELAPVQDKDSPHWVKSVVQFQTIKKQAAQQELTKTTGLITKAAEKGENVLREVVTAPGQDNLDRLQLITKAAEAFKSYETALTAIIPMTSSREMAFKMAAKFFPYGAAEGGEDKQQSPFHDAATALAQLRAASRTEATRQDDLFNRLLSGPVSYLLAYLTYEAACELQLQWEGNVLAAIQNMPEVKLEPALFDQEQGLVWKFVQGPAAPFLGRGVSGFYPRTCLEQQFPFTESFLTFLERGATERQMILPEYKVTIGARPTDVSREATLEPYATVLIMDCESGSQRLENYNYPASAVFSWKPENCGAVTLQILFNDFTLTKTYDGPQGFPNFLEDFHDGVKNFTPDDFSEHKAALEAIKVESLRVSYIIQGGSPLRKLLQSKQFLVPGAVVDCWDS